MQEIGAEKIYVINGQECWTKFKFDQQFIVKAHSNQVNMTKKKMQGLHRSILALSVSSDLRYHSQTWSAKQIHSA